ncbi:hypothetical protein [Geomicrobium sediminis]|uniref:Uncharacterized protein n=1 Tax=Geomicrobium sediminis TaxID=1347788 RepID=A0ABS2PFI5_9BACL|nr:hypothetical protein [Geomicrobium sediminis]MBM7634079.1 hypothetical protein [Geomicrobium sediminis]
MAEKKEATNQKQETYVAGSGIEYKFQHPGVLNWVRKRSQLIDVETKKMDQEQLLHYVHDNVIVDPKVDFGYWDENLEDFEEVTNEAQRFLRGVKKK